MTVDRLELLIAQYADGTLPASERAALEAVLATDERVRATLAEYRALDAAFRAVKGSAGPAVRWDQLAANISGAVSTRAAPTARDVPEDVEFAVAQYADGTLAAGGRADLEARLADDPAVADLLVGYRRVDDALRAADPVPAVRWDALASQISDAVTRHADASAPIAEQTEFAIAQFADGTLAADAVAAVEAELASNPSARLLLSEYRSLDGAIAAAAKADPVPRVRWDRLAAQLSRAVADEDEALQDREAGRAAAASPFRIFALLRSPMRLAAAASVVLAAGLGIYVASQPGTPPVVGPVPQVTRELIVRGPVVDAPAGEATIELSIGPPAALAGRPGETSGYTDDIASRPSRTIIGGAFALPAEADVGNSPF